MLKPIYYPVLLMALFTVIGHARPSFSTAGAGPAAPAIYNGHSIAASILGEKSLNDVNADRYRSWQLNTSGLSENAFKYAMKGLRYLSKANIITKRNIVSIVDFSKPSTQKRLYVIDVNSGKILFNTWVAHGHNSGDEYARRFSNAADSHQSSLGFYITLGTYFGGHGYSLRLKGCEKGFNDRAFDRSIVVHGADYVSNGYISSRGELGRSYGCPAIPSALSKEIIDVIKGGSCLFLYHPTKKYCSRSKIINSRV